MNSAEEVHPAICAAIEKALAEYGEYVTKMTAVIEVVDAEGERSLRLVDHLGAQPWESLGLLMFAVQQLQTEGVLRTSEED